MLTFLNYSLVLCWGIVCNSNVTMKFARLHCFLSQNVGGGTKDFMSPLSKCWGDMSPINSVPAPEYRKWRLRVPLHPGWETLI